MTDPQLHERIIQLLESGDSLPAREIAQACGSSRREVARLLHLDLRAEVHRDPRFCWRLAEHEHEAIGVAAAVAAIDSSPRTFVTSFLERRSLQRADGRELYKYRCSETEFEALHLAISDIVDFDPLGRSRPLFAPLFVLYAAEWWRRHQGSGTWAWEPVFESLELSFPAVAYIYQSVTEGLEAWKRPLLHGQQRRLFLVTLGCEGGLPLQVMKEDGARLRIFFREVLEDYGAYLNSGVTAAEVARRNEVYLRQSLRHDIVFELAGQLIESIWELQERAGRVKDPVAELDRIDPDWRKQLPLELDDAVASAFLNNLVQTAHRIRQGSTEDFRLTRYLTRRSEWGLHAELSFPPSIDAQKMSVLTGLAETDTPSRGQFVLVSSSGRKLSAVNVTKRLRRDGSDYVLERLGERVRIADVDAADGWTIQFESQRGAAERRDFRGATALSDEAPWTFGETEEGRWRFLGQGSLKTRMSECVVVLPPGAPLEEGEVLGEWHGRVIRRIGSSVELQTEAGKYRIQLGQSEEQTNSFRIAGERFRLSPDDREIFHGLPLLYELLGEERPRKVSEASMQWRPMGQREWRPWSVDCAGRVAIRVVHRDETRFTQTVEILPANVEVSLEGESANGGRVELRCPSNVQARPVTTDAVTATTTRSSEGLSIRMVAEREAQVPATATLQLELGDERRLQLVVPFPARGVRYVGPGEQLYAYEAAISVDVVALSRVDLFASGLERRRTVDATLFAEDLKQGEVVAFAVDLPSAVNGRVSYDLRRLVPQLQEMLSQTDDPEAFVSLQVDGSVGPNRLNVRKYDVEVDLSEDQAFATFKTNGEWGSEEDARFELIPLWRPGSTREPLFFDADAAHWRTDITQREAGPWLLVARTASGLTLRPRLLHAPGDVGGRPPLAAAISLSSKDEAQAAVTEALAQLVSRPLDEEWVSVVSIVKLSAELPSSSFFVTSELCRNLDAAVLALIHAGTERQLVWDTLQQFGVEWTLVPFTVWRKQIHRYGSEFTTALGQYEKAEELVVEQLEGLLEFLESGAERAAMTPIWDFLRWHLFDENDEGTVGRDRDSVIPYLRNARNELLARETTDRRWPTPPRLSKFADQLPSRLRPLVQQFATSSHQRPLFAAPLLAALSVADAKDVGRRVRGEFRAMRRFDQDWFDTAYRLALTMELNRTHAEEILARR